MQQESYSLADSKIAHHTIRVAVMIYQRELLAVVLE
jgi:hypothetical protein